MVKLAALPEQAIIDGFKGSVDFYVYMGIPVARSWPRKPEGPRSLAVQAQYSAFSYASKQWTNVSPELQAAYRAMATGTGLTGRDMLMRGYIGGLYRNPPP